MHDFQCTFVRKNEAVFSLLRIGCNKLSCFSSFPKEREREKLSKGKVLHVHYCFKTTNNISVLLLNGFTTYIVLTMQQIVKLSVYTTHPICEKDQGQPHQPVKRGPVEKFVSTPCEYTHSLVQHHTSEWM